MKKNDGKMLISLMKILIYYQKAMIKLRYIQIIEKLYDQRLKPFISCPKRFRRAKKGMFNSPKNADKA